MENIKTHILFVCDKCRDVKLVEKADHDLPTAVYVNITCPKCETEGFDDTKIYYDENGCMNDRENIFNSGVCLYCHKFYYHYASTAYLHVKNKFCSSKCEHDYDGATTNKPLI